MSQMVKEIVTMVEMLPEQEQKFAFEFIKRLVLAWDPDYTRVTPVEREQIDCAEKSGYINEKDIDWDNLNKMNFD